VQKPPGVGDCIFFAAFFFGMNALFLWLAWRRAHRAEGMFRWLYYVPMLPLVGMVSTMSWHWTSDMTADNLWPLALMMVGFPCWVVWQGLRYFERRRERA
jgi:hypothetical protein